MKHKSKKREVEETCSCDSHINCGTSNCGGAVYGLGVIGAAIYYISIATGFWSGVLGFLKALVWPVFLVNELLKFIGA
jgi:hypothetical protein